MHSLQQRIHAVRRDVGNLLFHFTRSRRIDTHGSAPRQIAAQDSLRSIIDSGMLEGGTGYIRGSHKCVCFSESPISEAASLFKLSALTEDNLERPRYEPYGVAVTKEWLFSKGGRPVICQTDEEYECLPEQLRYRHVHYNPLRGIDHTWEREWRIRIDRLRLVPDQTLVVVPTSREAFEIMYAPADWEPDIDRHGDILNIYPDPKWLVVSLDFFGVK